jgi:hypothetical protein
MTIPAPPPTLSVPPHTGVAAALAAVPKGVRTGDLDKNVLEAPLRDRARFERCRVPKTTRVQIDAVIYNGAAVGVDVSSDPPNDALDYCIEEVVRETSFPAQVAVNRVTLML